MTQLVLTLGDTTITVAVPDEAERIFAEGRRDCGLFGERDLLLKAESTVLLLVEPT
jgi:hypothetical protein